VFQKLQYDSDTSEKANEELLREPKISVKTRHPSGETNEKEATRVVESKRRSFIVSKVIEHSTIQEKITEDAAEDDSPSTNLPKVSTSDHPPVQQSPESAHSTMAGPSSAVLPPHQSDGEMSLVNESEKSTKSIGKGTVPVNIDDLQEKLVKLTGAGQMGQYPMESHSPVPSEDGGASTISHLSHTTQPHSSQQPQHQNSVESSSKGMPLSESSVSLQSTADKSQTGGHSLTQSQGQSHSSQGQGQSSSQGGAAIPQTQTSAPPQHTHQAQSNVTQQPPVTTMHQQPQQHKAPPQGQQGGVSQSAEMPVMSQPMYPQGMGGGMPFYHFMQPHMFNFPHQHGQHGMQGFSNEQMNYMNMQVPYVMIPVQNQQNQIQPMLVPANMIMHNQMPFPTSQPHQHQPPPTIDVGVEQASSQPPSTPPQNRKQHSTDLPGDLSDPQDASSPAPVRGNYSLTSLEQQLKNTLFGGSSRDIPMSVGAGTSGLNDEGSRLYEDRPHWTQSSDALYTVNSEPGGLDETLKKIEEDGSEPQHYKTVGATPSHHSPILPPQTSPRPVVAKKLRFQVSKVEDDPLKNVDEENEAVSRDDVDSSRENTPEDEDVKEGKSGENDKPESVQKQETVVAPRPNRFGRFSVQKVADVKEVKEGGTAPESSLSKETLPVDIANAQHSDVGRTLSVIINEADAPVRGRDEQRRMIEDVGNEQEKQQAGTTTDETQQGSRSIVSTLNLHDLPYRKKSMSFFEGAESPMISSNTCGSFYNTYMDKFRVFSRRRTKSLGSVPPWMRFSGQEARNMSGNKTHQHTQYGDGETPSPSPSAEEDRRMPSILFDLTSMQDELSSSSDDNESRDERESGIGIDSEPRERGRRPRPLLIRQARKVTLLTAARQGHVYAYNTSRAFILTFSSV